MVGKYTKAEKIIEILCIQTVNLLIGDLIISEQKQGEFIWKTNAVNVVVT